MPKGVAEAPKPNALKVGYFSSVTTPPLTAPVHRRIEFYIIAEASESPPSNILPAFSRLVT
jgi:hypothetical protein